MSSYTVKDLLNQVLVRLDRLDQQVGAANVQLGGYQQLAQRVATVEADAVNQSRILAIHESKPGHDGGAARSDKLEERVNALESWRDQQSGATLRSQALWLGSFTVLNALIALAGFVQHVVVGR